MAGWLLPHQGEPSGFLFRGTLSDQPELTIEHVRATVAAVVDDLAEHLKVPSFAGAVDKILAPLYRDVAEGYVRFSLQRGEGVA